MPQKYTKLDAKTIWDRINLAKHFYERERKDLLEKWANMYAGRVDDNTIEETNKVSVNYVFATITTKLATLYHKNPKVVVNPKRELSMTLDENGQPVQIDNVRNARNAEETLNYQIREYEVKKEVKKAFLDWKRSGYGVIFTGWEIEQRTVKKKKKVMKDTVMGKVLPSIFDKQKEKEIIEEQTETVIDRPNIKCIRPDRIYFAPESEEDKIPYIVIERNLPYDEVKDNPKYENTDDLPTGYVDEDIRGNNVGETSDMKRVKIYDYFDRDCHIVMADGKSDKILLEQENIYTDIFGYEDYLPVVILFGPGELGKFYPLSEVSLIWSQQRELNKIRAQEINHRKRFNRRYIYDNTVVKDPSDVEKLKNSDDGTMVGLALDNKDPRSIIAPIQDATLTYPFELEPRVKEDINLITGLPQYQFDGSAPAETLGQTQIIESHSQNRKDEERNQVEDFVTKIYRRLLQLNQHFLQDEIAFRIAGDSQEGVSWRKISPKDIQGEFDLEVESGSMLKLDDNVIRKQITDVFQIASGVPELQPLQKDFLVAVLETFQSVPIKQLKDKVKNLPPPTPPPPPPPEVPKVNVSLDGEDLPDEVKMLLIQKMLSNSQGQGQLPEPGMPSGMPGMDNRMLADGVPTESDLQSGVNQVL